MAKTATLEDAMDSFNKFQTAEKALLEIEEKKKNHKDAKDEYEVLFGKLSKDDQGRLGKITSSLFKTKTGKTGGMRITRKLIGKILVENNGLTYEEVKEECRKAKPDAKMENLDEMLGDVGTEENGTWYKNLSSK